MRRVMLAAVALAACGRGDPARSAPPPVVTSPADAAAPVRARSIDAGVGRPATLADGLERLREAGLAGAAAAIERRVAQRRPKMRLTSEQAVAAAIALLALADREPFRALEKVMPRSAVELARAVGERGLPAADAEAIAAYLVRVVAALDFQRLAVFDDNHSHVTGRDWHEIDYSGERMTWQGQKAHWQPRGVDSFRKAEYIAAYFAGAERMEHWKRVYRPRGRLADMEE